MNLDSSDRNSSVFSVLLSKSIKISIKQKKKVDAGSFSLVNNGRIYKKKRKMQMETVEKMIIGVYLLLIIYDYIISNTYFSS